MKLALVYDRINKIGGAERILQALHCLWPQAPLYTAVYNRKTAPYSQDWQIYPSFMQYLPLAKTNHELYPWLTPYAFESLEFKDFDLVISVTSAEAKGIITKPETLHVCYCLTPTRYLWSHTQEYQQQGSPLFRPLKNLLLTQLRAWDQVAAQRPDHYLAISQTVQRRIKKYYHRDSQVIYPPLKTQFFKPSTKRHKLKAKNYYLIISRLVAYKHIDLAIKACNQLHFPLVIIGTGKAKTYLQRLAGPTIKFLGQLTDLELLGYYENCRALIFPGEEDFGLTMLEAHSFGKPVIAYRRGGAREIVKENKTGLFFDTLSVQALKQALQQFKAHKFNPKQIRASVLKFDQHQFQQKFKDIIESLWQNHLKNLS